MAVNYDDWLRKATAKVTGTVAGMLPQVEQANQKAAQTAANNQAAYDAHPVNVPYDKNADYGDLMRDAYESGDYSGAARYEQQRNAKITGEKMDPSLYTDYYSQYLPENRYSFDPTKNPEYTAAKAQQDAIFNKIMSRDPFSYDPEADPLYQQYRDMYTRNGKISMRDTMGQAAALTGGYGSTYAQQAGQQSYDAYMQRLNDVLPDLYGQAYERYRAEGDNLLNQYNLAAAQAGDVRDQDYANWSTRLQMEKQDEANAYERRQYEQQQAYQKQQDSRSYLLTLITETGYQPTDADLAAAGMTRSEANALYQRYLLGLQSNNSGSGGGSGRGSSGRGGSGRSYGGNTATVTPEPQKAEPTAAEVAAQRKQQLTNSLDNMKKYGATKDEMVAEIERYVREYGLSDADAAELMRKYVNTTASTTTTGGKTGARGGGKTNTKGSY